MVKTTEDAELGQVFGGGSGVMRKRMHLLFQESSTCTRLTSQRLGRQRAIEKKHVSGCSL